MMTIKINGQLTEVESLPKEVVNRCIMRGVTDAHRAFVIASVVKKTAADYFFAAHRWEQVKSILKPEEVK